jgi:hypothetical protein
MGVEAFEAFEKAYFAECTFTDRSVQLEMIQIDLTVEVNRGNTAAADSTHISLRADKKTAHEFKSLKGVQGSTFRAKIPKNWVRVTIISPSPLFRHGPGPTFQFYSHPSLRTSFIPCFYGS